MSTGIRLLACTLALVTLSACTDESVEETGTSSPAVTADNYEGGSANIKIVAPEITHEFNMPGSCLIKPDRNVFQFAGSADDKASGWRYDVSVLYSSMVFSVGIVTANDNSQQYNTWAVDAVVATDTHQINGKQFRFKGAAKKNRKVRENIELTIECL